jgi:broad specificity phosphatase PhoE
MAGKTRKKAAVRRFEHPRNIVIVRHGETPANAARRTGRFFDSMKEIAKLGGKADHELPLNAKGIGEARRIGQLMREKWPFRRFDVCYDSGYERTMRTLDFILESFPENQQDETARRSHMDIRERDAGYVWTIPLRRGRKLFPWWEKYEKLVGPIYSRPPGGESIADAWLRVHMFLNSVRRSRPGQDLLVVTHGRIMMGFKYWMEKRPAGEVNELYEESKGIENCEAWWYRYSLRDRRYVLLDSLRP